MAERPVLKSTGFRFFLATQFLGAFNDNAFKIIISLLGIQLIAGERQGAAFVSIVGALFVLPFIVFSPLAGFLADRYRKRNVIVAMKIVELVIMAFGMYALWSKNLILLVFILFCMATQSAFFSPSKYGILPEILDEKNLSRGNGFLQMFTFVAIILGSAFGGKMKEIFSPDVWKTSFILIGLSILGLFMSIYISLFFSQIQGEITGLLENTELSHRFQRNSRSCQICYSSVFKC